MLLTFLKSEVHEPFTKVSDKSKAKISDFRGNLEFSQKSRIFAKISNFRENPGFSRKSRIFAKISDFRENLRFLRKSRIFANLGFSRKSRIFAKISDCRENLGWRRKVIKEKCFQTLNRIQHNCRSTVRPFGRMVERLFGRTKIRLKIYQSPRPTPYLSILRTFRSLARWRARRANFWSTRKFRRRENFRKKGLGCRDRFRPKIVEIGAILAIFEPFEVRIFRTPFFGEFGRSSQDLGESDYDSPKSWDDRPNSPKNGMRNFRTSNGSKIAKKPPISTILG